MRSPSVIDRSAKRASASTSAQTRVIYPEWLVTLIELNPLTYAIDALRGAFIHFNQFDPRLGPVVLVVTAAVFFLIALRDFRKF